MNILQIVAGFIMVGGFLASFSKQPRQAFFAVLVVAVFFATILTSM